jgi:hypothetical protein
VAQAWVFPQPPSITLLTCNISITWHTHTPYAQGPCRASHKPDSASSLGLGQATELQACTGQRNRPRAQGGTTRPGQIASYLLHGDGVAPHHGMRPIQKKTGPSKYFHRLIKLGTVPGCHVASTPSEC